MLRLVVGQGLLLAGIGVTIGLAASFGVTRVMSSLLYGVKATDVATFAAVASFFPRSRLWPVTSPHAVRLVWTPSSR